MKFGNLSGRRAQVFSILILILIAACPSQSGQSADALDTDVCSLNAHLKQFDERRVRVRAKIVRSPHGSAIFDPSKEWCGIALWYAKEADAKGEFAAVDDAILQERAKEVLGKTVIGTLTGELIKKPKHGRKPVFQADKVENLELGSSEPKSGDRKGN